MPIQIRKPLGMAALAALLAACAPGSYSPPVVAPPGAAGNVRTVDRGFDEAWATLVRHAAGSFFALDHYEKASGLMTLSFGATSAGRLIDCGRVRFDAGGRTVEMPYTEYVQQRLGARLEGKMNISVAADGPARSTVRVHARYRFIVPAYPPGAADVWTFDTGGAATVYVSGAIYGTQSDRTCVPTHWAEQSVLDALAKP